MFWVIVERCTATETVPAPALRAVMPPALLLTSVSVTNTWATAAWVQIDVDRVLREAEDHAVLDAQHRAGVKELDAVQARRRCAHDFIDPDITQGHGDAAAAAMTTPFVPATRTEATWPPAIDGDRLGDRDRAKAAGIEHIDLSGRGRLGDRPAKVLQGAVRLHGLASSPTPETQVRVACAWRSASPAPASPTPERPGETCSISLEAPRSPMPRAAREALWDIKILNPR